MKASKDMQLPMKTSSKFEKKLRDIIIYFVFESQCYKYVAFSLVCSF